MTRSGGPPPTRSTASAVSGILNIDKPAGATSMDVVRRIKRASNVKRVGHGGTLDPVATGVIPICLGQATRMMEYLVDGTKEYRCTIELGVETDTYDSLGMVVARGDASAVSRQDVEAALISFEGMIDQVPPMFSALKKGGKRLYDLARSGIEVDREPRQVEVIDVSLVDWAPASATVEVTCGRGFYMRSLAHDLGEVLGCGGHLSSLTRLRSGPLRLDDAIGVEEAEERFEDGSWREYVQPVDVVVGRMRAVIVGRQVEDRLRHGRPLSGSLRMPFLGPDEQCRVYSTDGRFLAIVSFDASAGEWKPQRVFNLAYDGGSDA